MMKSGQRRGNADRERQIDVERTGDQLRSTLYAEFLNVKYHLAVSDTSPLKPH